jgi:small subunit ribosomal protein S13
MIKERIGKKEWNRIQRKKGKDWKKVTEVRRVPHYLRGIARRTHRPSEKARVKGRYGCGRVRAKEVCRACGISGKQRRGKVHTRRLERREEWLKENIQRGSDRLRRENESITRHRKLGTVRGVKRRRGLPVRGQRTSTNAITARKRNRKRGISML